MTDGQDREPRNSEEPATDCRHAERWPGSCSA
ncbi:hypothetical protein SBADM41S_10887 [Streptomyces badius]